MIYISNLSDRGIYRFDEIYAIVRSLKSSPNRIVQMQSISPSCDLLGKYRYLVKNGQWNKDTFQTIYVPQFLKEMQSAEAHRALNYLYSSDKKNKNIALVCFCKNEELCHRCIIAGLLQELGCTVYLPSHKDYTDYYRLYVLNRQRSR